MGNYVKNFGDIAWAPVGGMLSTMVKKLPQTTRNIFNLNIKNVIPLGGPATKFLPPPSMSFNMKRVNDNIFWIMMDNFTSAKKRVKLKMGGYGIKEGGKLLQSPLGAGIFWGIAALGFSASKQLIKSFQFRPADKPARLGSGPGYISWSKSSGMPHNHLSTDGLSLSLNNMRHTSQF